MSSKLTSGDVLGSKSTISNYWQSHLAAQWIWVKKKLLRVKSLSFYYRRKYSLKYRSTGSIIIDEYWREMQKNNVCLLSQEIAVAVARSGTKSDMTGALLLNDDTWKNAHNMKTTSILDIYPFNSQRFLVWVTLSAKPEGKLWRITAPMSHFQLTATFCSWVTNVAL